MRKLFLTILVCISSVLVNAQNNTEADPNKPKTLVEKPPSFPGGLEEMNKFIDKNLKYTAGPTKKTKAACYVSFVVEIDGTITDAKIMKPAVNCKECNQEALRIVGSMPKWVPGMDKGRIVRANYVIPFRFTSKEDF